VLRFFHVAEVTAEVDDARHVGLGKLDASAVDESARHDR
jgi:hypothetical protein